MELSFRNSKCNTNSDGYDNTKIDTKKDLQSWSIDEDMFVVSIRPETLDV